MQKIRSLTFLAIVVYSSCLNNNYANRLSSSDEAIFDSSIYVSDDSSAAAAAASSSWPMLSAGAGSKMGQAAACVSIPRNFSLCHGIDYDKMRLPNLLEHETLDEAVQQSTPWVSLLRLNCHTEAKLFLCSLFAPVCLERAIYPCRSLCETVKTGCEKRMQAYGFPWPDMLNCAKFPVTNDMCIQPRENYQVNQSCSSCDQVDTFENILDHFCRSDYVFKVKVHALGRNALQVKRGKAFKVKSPQNVQNFPLNGLKLKLTDGGDENNNETPCPCNVLSQDRSLEKRYLVMANRTSSGDYVLNLVLPWKKDKMQFKRAKRMFHKLDCKTLGTRIRERARRERTKMLTTQAAAGSSPQRHTRRPPPTNQNGFSTPAPSGRRRNNGNGQKNHRQKTPPTAQLAVKNGLRTSGQQHRQRKIEDEKLLAQHDRRNHHRHHHNQNGRKNRKNSAAKNGRQTNRSLEDTFL